MGEDLGGDLKVRARFRLRVLVRVFVCFMLVVMPRSQGVAFLWRFYGVGIELMGFIGLVWLGVRVLFL